MSIGGLIERVDDSLNPIVVKELRQAVKSRFLVAVLTLFLLLQLGILGFLLLSQGLDTRMDAIDFRAGRKVFQVLQAILLSVCMLFIPAYTGFRLAAERSDTNVDLLFISTLRPSKIISGKFFAAVILVLLIFSACAPFMAFTYLLRGIDIPSILFILAIDFAAVLVGTQVAILIAAVPATRSLRGMLGLIGFGLLINVFSFAMGGTISLVEFGGGFMSSREFWGLTGLSVMGIVSALALMFALSVATVSPPSSNRALPVRLTLLAIWLISGIVMGIWAHEMRSANPVGAWSFLAVLLLSAVMIFASNERETWTPRVTRAIPRNPLLWTFAFLLYSGSAGGFVFSAILIFLTLLINFGFLTYYAPPVSAAFQPVHYLQFLIVSSLYVAAYTLTAICVRNLFSSNWVKPAHTWIVLLALLAAGSIIPYLVVFFLFYDRWFDLQSNIYWSLTNPFQSAWVLLEARSGSNSISAQAVEVGLFAGCWAVIALLLALPWFFAQVRRFKPYSGGAASDG